MANFVQSLALSAKAYPWNENLQTGKNASHDNGPGGTWGTQEHVQMSVVLKFGG